MNKPCAYDGNRVCSQEKCYLVLAKLVVVTLAMYNAQNVPVNRMFIMVNNGRSSLVFEKTSRSRLHCV